jgi:hypothetical protein
MDAGGWCQASDVLGEGNGGPIDQAGTLWEADRPPGSPVHWNSAIWLSLVDHLRRLLGIEMTLTKGWSPTSDGEQRDVDLRHLIEGEVRTSVPRIPAPARTLDKVAECGSAMRAPWMSSAVVVGGQSAYPQAACFHKLIRLDLAELHTPGDDWLE